MLSLPTSIDTRQIRKTITHWLYQPYKWFVFLPILIVCTNLTTLFIAIFMALGKPRLARFAPVIWARINAGAAGVQVQACGREHIQPGQSYVVVANHASHFDVLAIYGWLGVDLRWVMKKELRKVPALGYACELLGHVYIDRSNPEQAKKSIDAAKGHLSGGTSIFFFPEGTRSNSGEMQPFKKGAFHLAQELGLPVLPVTIRGAYDILPPHSLNVTPGPMELIIHPPIHHDALTSLDELSQQARDSIKSAL